MTRDELLKHIESLEFSIKLIEFELAQERALRAACRALWAANRGPVYLVGDSDAERVA